MNACHMSNAIFGKDFDLGALDSFCYVWTCLYSWCFDLVLLHKKQQLIPWHRI
jgi:hypothetical protein